MNPIIILQISYCYSPIFLDLLSIALWYSFKIYVRNWLCSFLLKYILKFLQKWNSKKSYENVYSTRRARRARRLVVQKWQFLASFDMVESGIFDEFWTLFFMNVSAPKWAPKKCFSWHFLKHTFFEILVLI